VEQGLGDWDMGRGTRGHRDAGTRGRGDAGTRGRGDASARGDLRMQDEGTGGRDKQTSPDFCTEFVKYNFRRSSEK